MSKYAEGTLKADRRKACLFAVLAGPPINGDGAGEGAGSSPQVVGQPQVGLAQLAFLGLALKLLVDFVGGPQSGGTDGVAEGLVGFYAASQKDGQQIRDRLRSVLPPHMVPARIEAIETMPLNANGKIDRTALYRELAGEGA